MTVGIRAADARIEIEPAIGGALARFVHGDRDVLRPTSDDARAAGNVRLHACYPLVPYSNRIAGARLAFGSRTYELARNFGDHPHAIHGVGWQRAWKVAALDERSAVLSLEHRPHGPEASAWPWAFDASQSIAISSERDRALATFALAIRNVGDEPFPFGLGWHPFLPRGADTALGFRARGVWETGDTQLPTAHVAASGRWSFEARKPIGDDPLDNVYTGWDGEATLVDASRASTAIRADRACAFLVVYAPRSRRFIALEPVTHMTDAFNRAQRGESATGTRVLAPGSAFSCTMQIESRLAP